MRFPAPIATPLLAAGLALAAHGAVRAAALDVPLNHSVRLAVGGRAASVLIGNAGVADVTVVDSHTLFVTGKSPGSTDVKVVDPLGRTVYAADILVSLGGGRAVTVHRGAVRAELACDPRCLEPPAGPSNPQATSPLAGVPGAEPPATPAGQVGAAIGGAVGGAVSGGILGGGGAPAPRAR